ncbi:MAG TPA: transglycosylase domain-containing protein [Hyphomonadaceae bacterium]|nr:transglycosylase domain-containing protein [Hyphomonadaceae bacterium]
MSGLIRGLLGLVLALVILMPSGTLIFIWWDGSQLLGQKQAQVWTTPRPAGETTPLTPLEATAANAIFSKTWNVSGTPCRTYARFFINYTGKPDKDGLSVSQVIARDIASKLSPGVKLRQQLQQLSVACQLEQQYDDATLLRMYLRQAYFGGKLVGSDAASDAIFHKAAGLLTPDESAKLVSLIYWPDGQQHPSDWDRHAKLISDRASR